MRLSLSAGHGYFTSGKRAPDESMREGEFNSAVVSKMVNLFYEKHQKVEILRLDDSTGKTDIPLSVRATQSNNFKADFHLDVHANAYGTTFNTARGIETYIYNSIEDGSLTWNIARHIHDSLIINTGMINRGLKQEGFYMLKETNAPAVLVECGFMTNLQDLALLKSDDYRALVARTLVDAIADSFKIANNDIFHSVAPGETFWRIANLHGMRVEQLKKINPGISDPSRIYPGQKIRVR
ncbi:N-acetylmuramoyl-L-alanine amidase [Bacillus sp. V3-13]|uniref:N-acetylmuramoyl-L-alanine amidase n=1 Tax=Bacillus sp. V3-13 TaxID=2053728 RepID=UPI000C776944|nr:N-acetylmuramoyl-L-alanine amidase [Bacillus sp. V3-13]PLR75284.1 N-acetylmuramoyl-L-alanine amidase [Bacillus sp. V3-13]